MNELDAAQKKMFDDLRRIDENGNEYRLARELQTALLEAETRKQLKSKND